MQPDYIIKNKVSEQDFEQIVYKWLSDGDYTPDDIIENIITQNNIVLMPLYYSRDEYSGSCSVSLGYRRLEYYSTWDNEKKKNVQQSRWVTDWRPHSQMIQGVTVTTVYAGQLIPESVADFVENMGWEGGDLNQVLIENSPYYQELCSLFKVSKEESWEKRGSKKAYQKALKDTIPKLPSSIQMNLSLDIKFTEKLFFSVLAPYWLFNYKYQDANFYVIVDGNNPTRINGIKPEDKKRKNHVLKLRLFGWIVGIFGTTLALFIFSDQSFDNIDFSWKNVAIVAIGITVTASLINIEVGKIKNKSKKARQQSLSLKLKRLT